MGKITSILNNIETNVYKPIKRNYKNEKKAAKQDYLNILVVLVDMLDPIKRLIRSGARWLERG